LLFDACVTKFPPNSELGGAQTSLRIAAINESSHRLKMNFPYARLHASLSACFNFVTHTTSLR